MLFCNNARFPINFLRLLLGDYYGLLCNGRGIHVQAWIGPVVVPERAIFHSVSSHALGSLQQIQGGLDAKIASFS